MQRRTKVMSAVAFFLAAIAGSAFAQDGADKKTPKKNEPFESKEPIIEQPIPAVPYWASDAGYSMRATVHLIGAGNPLGALGVRILASDHQPILLGWNFEFDQMLPIYGRYLSLLKDNRKLPVRDPKNPQPLADADKAMLLAYYQALERSYESSMDMFEKSALEFNHVTFAHLRATPGKYRGKIITVEGQLKVIRKHDKPRDLREPQHIYTGWVVGPHKHLPAYTIVFTDLPPQMRVSETLDVKVRFQGYFLAFVKFPPDTPGQKEMISPYLVGRTFTILEPVKDGAGKDDSDEKTSYSYHYIAWTLGAIILVAIAVAMVNVWFRRGDDAVKTRLREVRDRNQAFGLSDEQEGTASNPPLATPIFSDAPPSEEPPPTPPAEPPKGPPA